MSLFINHLNANEKDLQIIQKDKKEYRLLDKESIQTRQQSQKYDWISPIDLSGNIGRNHSFSDLFSLSISHCKYLLLYEYTKYLRYCYFEQDLSFLCFIIWFY